MPKVYIISDNGTTREMTRTRCKDESKELQDAIHLNHDILPGDQIDPEDPRRWLLIKREMPVPDPNTGENRWSIDFVFVDQSAVLTLVECKRYNDTRARREVVGQVIEYAANGQYYWSGELLKQYAEESARESNESLRSRIERLHPDDDMEVDADVDLFEQAISNLKEGVVRIIFYLEEAPRELKSIADFLNQQMKRAEVLVVEARQYSNNNQTIIVPQLFGYTEQARLSKESVKIVSSTPRNKHTWTKELFFEHAGAQLHADHVQAIKYLYDISERLGAKITLGKGKKGSINPKFMELCQRSLISVYTNGSLVFNFAWLAGNPQSEYMRDCLYRIVIEKHILPLNDEALTSYPAFEPEVWVPVVKEIGNAIEQAVHSARKILEQSGAEYPPQGVGSSDP